MTTNVAATPAVRNHVEPDGGIDVTATENLGLQTLAAVGAFSKDGTGVGATINVEVLHSSTKAYVDGYTDEAGNSSFVIGYISGMTVVEALNAGTDGRKLSESVAAAVAA